MRNIARNQRGGVAAWIAGAAIVLGIILGTMYHVAHREERKVKEFRGSIAEHDACTKAGLVEPVWRPCGNGGYCFFCADERGILTAVREPTCNTEHLDACSTAE